VPSVIGMAPLGLTSWFYGKLHDTPGPIEIWLHVVFWSLFLVGAFWCKRLPDRIVIVSYACIVILLLVTLAGCEHNYHWAGQTIN
jgi:hypothetical protein